MLKSFATPTLNMEIGKPSCLEKYTNAVSKILADK